MDFFTRRNPCLFIEKKLNPEDTKKAFSNKLLFYQHQYKLAYESIYKSQSLSDSFLKSSLYSLDFNSKLLDCLQYLSSNLDFEWSLLESICSKDPDKHLYGTLDPDVLVIETEYLIENSARLFLFLNQCQIIDSETFCAFGRLRDCRDFFSTAVLNDFAYYSEIRTNLIKPLSIFEKFIREIKESKGQFENFLGKKLTFKGRKVIFWSFLKNVSRSKDYKYSATALLASKYNYEKLKQNNQNSEFGFIRSLVSGIRELSDISSLYSSLSEFKLSCSKSKSFFFYIFSYFLSLKGGIFDTDNPFYVGRKSYERFVSAVKFIDLIKFLCEEKINLRNKWSNEMKENFVKLCEIELSVLRDKVILGEMMVLNHLIFKLASDLLQELLNNEIYKKIYSPFMSKYFLLLQK